MDYLRSDYILRDILEERKSLTGFLDAIFGFMSRHTDFFHIQKTNDKLGFPRGVKEQILMSCMQKYEQPILEMDLITDDPPPIAVDEVEIATEETSQVISDEKHLITNENDYEISELLKHSNNDTIIKFNESDYKNGSVFENYCWSQTLKDIELYVILPTEVKLAKHVNIDLKTNQINIKTLLPKELILISAETWDKYRHNDVVWTITDGKLQLSFDKLKECWWDKLFINEVAIDIKKVDTERPIDEYSEETQNDLKKMHLKNNQETDLKTLPVSESEQLKRLHQAWNAADSPFKGQPFDPSVIKFN